MGVLTNAKIEVFNFRNKKSHVEKFYSFQYFVDFSTDLDSPDLKFFRTGPKFAHIFEQHFQNLLSARKKKSFLRKNVKLKNSQTPKSKAIFGIFLPISPKSARKKVY